MFEIDLPLSLALIAFVLFEAIIALFVLRKRIIRAFKNRFKHADTVFDLAAQVIALLCIPAGFFLLEITYNTQISNMNPYYVCVGIFLCAVLFTFIYSIGQRSKISMLLFLFLCWFAGTANNLIVDFRSQPILPSDFAALQTAAAVSEGYIYVFDDLMLSGVIIVEFFVCLLLLLPRQKQTKKMIAFNTSIAVVVAVFCVLWFQRVDIEERYNCVISAWDILDSYREQGFLLCFLQNSQHLFPDTPDNYSHEEAESLLTGTSTVYDEDEIAISADDLATASEALAEDVQPTVIVIMNETFVDLSNYSAIEDYEGATAFSAISEESLLSGYTYVSTIGGGTCNSEFEFLTGSTLGYLGSGSYPYMYFNLSGVSSLVEYFDSQGYDTTAIHPANAYNWRRDKIYSQFGFDEFLDITAFEDADTRRGLVTDAETYSVILDLLESSDSPQFIFDVTIANHSGYTTGEIPEDGRVYVSVNGENSSEIIDDIDEFVSCITYSDIEFAEFIDQLRDIDQPVIVCMFGDHQPWFASQLATDSNQVELEDMSLEQAQQRYVTPYLIWTNSDELKEAYGVGNVKNLSLNYLGSNIVKAAGLELDDRLSYLLAIEELIPIINLSGYTDDSGQWHYFEEETDLQAALDQLEIIQYDNLQYKNQSDESSESNE